MVYILPVFMIIVAYFSGRLPEVLLKDKKNRIKSASKGETCLTGMFLLFLIWDILALASSYLGIDVMVTVRVYVTVMAVILITANILLFRKRKPKKWYSDIQISGKFYVAVLLFVIQAVMIFLIAPDVPDDNVKTAVMTLLDAGKFHVVNPETGMTEGYNVSFWGRIPELDSYYAMLSCLTDHKTDVLIYVVIPLIVLMFSYMAYGLWIDLLCDSTEEGKVKKSVLYIVIGMLNICGSISTSGIFYYQLHCGFRAEVIVYSVLVPYTAYLCYRIFREKDHSCVIRLVLTCLTSLTVTEPVKGLVPLLAVAAVCAGTVAWIGLARKHGWIGTIKVEDK